MSCLFDSLRGFAKVHGQEPTSFELRQYICTYLLSDPQVTEGMRMSDAIAWTYDGVTLPQYVKYMRQAHVWGGAHEIKSFCDLFGCKVVVHVLVGPSRRTIETLPLVRRNNKVVHITWNGYHYEPLELTREE